jgi:hypothetical protein
MRICELVIAIMPAEFFAPSLAPCENCGAVRMDIFRRQRLNSGGRRHCNVTTHCK